MMNEHESFYKELLVYMRLSYGGIYQIYMYNPSMERYFYEQRAFLYEMYTLIFAILYC